MLQYARRPLIHEIAQRLYRSKRKHKNCKILRILVLGARSVAM
jgi:hypothetical protein